MFHRHNFNCSRIVKSHSTRQISWQRRNLQQSYFRFTKHIHYTKCLIELVSASVWGTLRLAEPSVVINCYGRRMTGGQRGVMTAQHKLLSSVLPINLRHQWSGQQMGYSSSRPHSFLLSGLFSFLLSSSRSCPGLSGALWSAKRPEEMWPSTAAHSWKGTALSMVANIYTFVFIRSGSLNNIITRLCHILAEAHHRCPQLQQEVICKLEQDIWPHLAMNRTLQRRGKTVLYSLLAPVFKELILTQLFVKTENRWHSLITCKFTTEKNPPVTTEFTLALPDNKSKAPLSISLKRYQAKTAP